MKAVGMCCEGWKTKEIADAEKEKDGLREKAVIQSAENKQQDQKVKSLVKERKMEI